MSEEEIIDEIKYNILNDPFIVFSQDSSFEDVQIKANAIQGLLDLYNKEKEKNKLQEETLIEFAEEREKLLKTPVVSKDKINTRIEEIKKIFPNDVMFTREFLITELKGLLED